MVKRILNKYGYPPDLQEEAMKTVLMQAELLCADWVWKNLPAESPPPGTPGEWIRLSCHDQAMGSREEFWRRWQDGFTSSWLG